jgi:hypothetical protein
MIGPYLVLEGKEEPALVSDLMQRIPTLNCAGTVDRWRRA